jgi:hypothetical protein
MARRVFFSFHYEADAGRAGVVRNHSITKDGFGDAGYIDAAAWETIKRQGDQAIKNWINQQLQGTTVTVVLIGAETAQRQWVQYEIQRSWDKGNRLMGVRIHNIKDFRTGQTSYQGQDPFTNLGFTGIPVWDWVNDNGYNNFARWVEQTANMTRK